MKSRAASKIQSKLVMLLFGSTFTGKTTLGLQLADFVRNDGKPFRLMVVDAEMGGADDALEELEARGVDMRNVYVFYTQSLQELKVLLDKIKNHETFYEYDEDGNETDDAILDADGNEFFPDAIMIDGTTIFRLTSEQGLLELSKKRNTIKANNDGLVGDARTVKIQGADLEFKDYKKLNYSGQSLVLDLMALDINVVLTAREKDITTQKLDKDGNKITVSTGETTYDSFKGLDYNVKTILRMYQDPETGQICAQVKKDRTKVHRPGEILEDPTLLDWQTVIDKNANRKSFVLKNDLDKAVATELEMYEKDAMQVQDSDNTAVNDATTDKGGDEPKDEIAELKAEIRQKINALTPPEKQAMREKLKESKLPVAYKNVMDADVLQKVLEVLNK